ncbi:cytochrome c maturation protein CcmE [bacterium SCSIO 12741]|nr:cytochrome c maturation protein CcmE [bacterium SCSIO 12741]
MKKTHIIGIIIIAVAIGVIFGSIGDAGTYADFGEAFGQPGTEFHVVGELSPGRETEYNPEVDPDRFVFYMVDKQGQERKVVLHKNKPQDFEHAEQIVIIGEAQGEDFHASQILLKCPSKYNDGNPEFKTPEEYESERNNG